MPTVRLTTVGVLFAVAAMCVPLQAQQAVNPDLAKLGKNLFARKGCAACHGFGKKMAGPDLRGVTERRDDAWLRRWLKAPDQMITTDSIAQALYAQYNKAKMPNLKLTDEEVEALINYLAQETQSHAGK